MIAKNKLLKRGTKAGKQTARSNAQTQTAQAVDFAMSNKLQMGGGLGATPRRPPRGSQTLGYPVSIPGAMEFTYNALGNTNEGREFALVNLHPCGEYVTEAPGIPDESQVSSVTPAFRGDNTIAVDPAYFATPITLPAEYRYDIQLVVLPIPEVDFIFRVRVPVASPDWSMWVVRRTTYFSNAADGTAITMATSGYSSSRMIGRGITVHFDAPKLADQGRLVAGQIKPVSRTEDVTPPTVNSTSSVAAAKVTTYYVPQSETELMQQDPAAAQWEARSGTYIPHRFIQPTQLFSSVQPGTTERITFDIEGGTSGRIDMPAAMFCLADSPDTVALETGRQRIYHRQTPTWNIDGTVPPGIPSPNTCDWGVSDPLNQYTSVQFFLGMQHTSQLHIKTRLYLENEAHARDSPVTPFLHKSPSYDFRAMQIVALVAQNQQHVFYAADNDLSSILQSIGKILPGLLGALEGSGLPLASTAGMLGGHVGRGLKALLSSF